MMQHVKTDQAGVEVAVIRVIMMIGFRFRHSITNRDSIRAKGEPVNIRLPMHAR